MNYEENIDKGRSNQQIQEGACPRDSYGLFRRAAMGFGNLFGIIGLVLDLGREARRLEKNDS